MKVLTKHILKVIAVVCMLLSMASIFYGVHANAGAMFSPVNANPNIFVDLSKKVVPSVVNISVEIGPSKNLEKEELLRRQFEEHFGFRVRPQHRGMQKALGTGVVVDIKDNKAIILTNNHVVKKASTVKVQFDEAVGEEKPILGEVIGQDPDLDLALIEVEIKKNWKVKALPFGNSDQLQVGEYVMAVGNPFGQGHSVSHGIVSGKGRNAPIIGKYLQTDAPINPGNSGGPLVNLQGEIIGINNAILAQAQGIGFAIPSNSVKVVLDELKKTGKVERGYIGVLMGKVSPEAATFSGKDIKAGAPFALRVEKNSPADQAGVKPNDIIVKFAGKKIESPEDLKMAVVSQPINKKVKIEVLRSGRTKMLTLRIGKPKV